jgi:hypothetical protein
MVKKAKEERHNDKPLEEIPEVAAYQEVRARYDAFRASNPEFFAYLDGIEEELNTKLEDAEKATRAQNASCGDFHLYQFGTKYNAEELLQAVGRDKFLQVGGTMTTQTVYGVDKARVDASIASGDIPADTAERVRVKQPRFHKPDKLVIL